jgi:hypothetical protein
VLSLEKEGFLIFMLYASILFRNPPATYTEYFHLNEIQLIWTVRLQIIFCYLPFEVIFK